MKNNYFESHIISGTIDEKIENKKDNLDPYRDWQTRMIKAGELNPGEINEISYIKFAIDNGDIKDIDKALWIAEGVYRERSDLISDLYIKRGDLDEAKRIILSVKDSTLYDVMAGPIDKIKKINPDLAMEIVNDIKNLEDKRYFEALRAEFYTEEIE